MAILYSSWIDNHQRTYPGELIALGSIFNDDSIFLDEDFIMEVFLNYMINYLLSKNIGMTYSIRKQFLVFPILVNHFFNLHACDQKLFHLNHTPIKRPSILLLS